MNNVIKGDLLAYGDIPVEKVLDGAKGCSEVMVLGYNENGFYLASSVGEMWKLENMINDAIALLESGS